MLAGEEQLPASSWWKIDPSLVDGSFFCLEKKHIAMVFFCLYYVDTGVERYDRDTGREGYRDATGSGGV